MLVPSAVAQRNDTTLPSLYVNYSLNCTFRITDDSGKPLTSIAPGSYQLQIMTPQVFAEVDLSGIFDMTACKSFVQFQLTGPGVNISTTLQDGDEDYGEFTVTFQPSGTYVAVDNNQPSLARVSFTTLSSGTPITPTSPVTGGSGGAGTTSGGTGGGKSAIGTSIGTDPLRGTLIGLVSAAGKLSLTDRGKAVASLESGRYTVTVTDESAKGGFNLQQSKKNASAVTGIAFVGKKTVTLDFKPGQWLFYPTVVGTKSYFIVTAAAGST